MAELFNGTLRKLLQDLHVVFPEDAAIRRYNENADVLLKLKPAYAQEMFEKSFGSKPEKIQSKDESIFDDFPKLFSIDFKSLWTRASAANREVIWRYLQQLNLTSKIGSAVPPEIMTAAEKVAQSLASKGIDPAADIQSVFSEFTKNPDYLSSLFQSLQGPSR